MKPTVDDVLRVVEKVGGVTPDASVYSENVARHLVDEGFYVTSDDVVAIAEQHPAVIRLREDTASAGKERVVLMPAER